MTLFGLLICIAASAQAQLEPQAPSAVPSRMLPFPDGEKLIFEIKLSRFPLYVTLGNITFEYAGTATDTKIEGAARDLSKDTTRELIRLRAEAISKGFLVSLFGINVRDRFETLVDKGDFSARLSFRDEEEGKKHVARTSHFDPVNRTVTYNVVDLNKAEAAARIKELPRKERMQSLLSAIYYFRTFELANDEVVCFPVSEEEQNHEFEIYVRGREALQLGETKLHTIKLEPRLFGPGRYFSREGEMEMWVTDDERRVPVRLVARTSAGTITATLTNYDAQPPLRKITKPSGTAPAR